MRNSELITSLTRTFSKVGFNIKKHSPDILMATGVVGIVASGVMACTATLKVDEVLDKSKNDIDRIHEAADKGVTAAGEDYSVEDSKKDLTIVYAKTGVELVKLYAPSVLLGALSISAVVTSNNILRKRNAALVAAYTTLDKSFKNYRKRVAERFGDEVENEIRHDIKAREVKVTEKDENGEEREITKIVESMNPELNDEYTRFFDCGQMGWDKDPQATLCYLLKQQAYANDQLKLRGHLTLNDVYEMLDIPRIKEGYLLGWVYDEKNPIGDNYVDFGLHNGSSLNVNRFVNGDERAVKLTFNYDGVIYDLIK